MTFWGHKPTQMSLELNKIQEKRPLQTIDPLGLALF